jgi:hypothetical protein
LRAQPTGRTAPAFATTNDKSLKAGTQDRVSETDRIHAPRSDIYSNSGKMHGPMRARLTERNLNSAPLF